MMKEQKRDDERSGQNNRCSNPRDDCHNWFLGVFEQQVGVRADDE